MHNTHRKKGNSRAFISQYYVSPHEIIRKKGEKKILLFDKW